MTKIIPYNVWVSRSCLIEPYTDSMLEFVSLAIACVFACASTAIIVANLPELADKNFNTK